MKIELSQKQMALLQRAAQALETNLADDQFEAQRKGAPPAKLKRLTDEIDELTRLQVMFGHRKYGFVE